MTRADLPGRPNLPAGYPGSRQSPACAMLGELLKAMRADLGESPLRGAQALGMVLRRGADIREGHADISRYGGWRAYRSRAAPAGPG